MISSGELRKLAKESGEKVYWDEIVCEDASLENIDEEKVRWFLKEARKQRGLNLSEDAPIEEALMKLKLLFKQLFWVKYVEVISRCREWGIPEPVFEHITGAFVVTFKLPPALGDLEKLGLNKRQIRAVNYVVKQGSITNREYQTINNTTRYTATRDLGVIVKAGIFDKIGEGKRDLRYVLIQNAAKMRQKNTQKGDDSGSESESKGGKGD